MRRTRTGLLWLAAGLLTLGDLDGFGAEAEEAAPRTIWQLGNPDGVSIEFAAGSRNEATFTVGESVVSRDFPGRQSGSVSLNGERSEAPYTLVFDLPESAGRPHELVLDLLFQTGAPERIKFLVNGLAGVVPIRIEPMESVFGEQANNMLLAKQRLVVFLKASWLQPKENRITIIPLGLGSLEYDAMLLREVCCTSTTEPLAVRPTIYFKERDGVLFQLFELAVPFLDPIQRGSARVRVGAFRAEVPVDSEEYAFGVLTRKIEVPAADEALTASVEIKAGTIEMAAENAFPPTKRWRIFVCPKVHNDVGYTDLQPHVNELDNRNTDTALEIMDRFPFYKFNFETAWLVDNYLDCRPEEWRERFFRYARENRAVINVLYLNLMTGLCSGEELYRSLYYAHRLHREQGSSFNYACLTDAPSHSWFLPTLLTDVGVKAFSNGSNQTRAPILHFSELNEDSPFWWEGINGERILMWYARSYLQWKRLTGPGLFNESVSYDYLRRSVPQFLTRYRRPDYVGDALMVYGAYVDNAAIPETGEAELVERWNSEYAFPRLLVASDAEYFDYVEREFGGELPVYRGDAGAYWEDGAASTAAATALNRRTHEILPAAETAASLATLFRPRERYPAEDFWKAWKNVMFYDEHTWGAFTSISQPGREFVERQWEIKEDYAVRANLDARTLLARAFNRLCQNVSVEGDTVLVFNWQNRPRRDLVEVELGSGQYLVDLGSAEPVPLDVLFERDGWKRVRFLAGEVPAFGYRGYAIRGLDAPDPTKNEPRQGWTLESRHYRLTVDRKTGGLASLVDKRYDREWADSASGLALNEYVYVTGGEGSLILNHTFGTPPADLTLHRPSKVRLVENLRTPHGQRLVVEASAKNTPKIRSEYHVYDEVRRVDIVNTVTKEPTRAKEAVYFAFPFAARDPAFEVQIQNGWCRPNLDQLPGACREWFTPRNVIHLSDGEFDLAWATPDAPLVCLTDINRGKWPTHLEIENGHLYSYAMHNYWFTNYRAEQGGELRFRYSIGSGREMTRAELAHFDSDVRSPVLAYPLVSTFSVGVAAAGRPLSAASGSFLELEDPNLEIVVLKEAEDGDGFILRVREVSGESGSAELRLPGFSLKRAFRCNGVEENQAPLPATEHTVTIPYAGNTFTTVRLVLGLGAARP